MDFWTFEFDSASLQRITRLAGFEAQLKPEMRIGMMEIVDYLQLYAESYMYSNFKNPQGALEDAVQTEVPDSYTGIVYNDSPYAWRREVGFSGMTDALGRFYPFDPGIAYFENTLDNNIPFIETTLEARIAIALTMLGA